jgi:hypothetical protein
LNARAEIRNLKKDRSKLLNELDGLRNLSIDEIPDAETKITPQQKPDVDLE